MKDFIQELKELIHKSPHLAVHNFKCENSDYSDQLNESKNAYVCFNGYGIEDCLYTYDSRWNKDCAELSYSNKCELCYECVDCDECYNCNFCQDCERCTDCTYCYDCFGCKNCFGCVNLKSKEYHIFNKKYSKEEYKKELINAKKVDPKVIGEHRLKQPRISNKIRRAENCTGNYIFDSKNSNFVFKVYDLEDCTYVADSRKQKNCIDTDMIFNSELNYEAVEANNNYNCNFLYWCANCNNCEYIMYCFNCENCFGCFNLKRKKFHILNKPYSEEEYFIKVKQIKEELRKDEKYYNFLSEVA